MANGPYVTVPSPERKPRKGGIKSVVGEFKPLGRLGAAEGIQWVSDGCDFPKGTAASCYVLDEGNGDPKQFVGIDKDNFGPLFALYAGVQCFLGPESDNDYEARARRLLEQGEARGVEEWLWDYANTNGGTAPAQTSWAAAIGQADEAADTLYLGQPVMMMSRFAAVQARAAKALFGDEETGRLWTANGTPVIASASASDTVLVVMGWPTIYASSEVVVTETYHLPLNQQMGIAERIYAIAVDCNFALHYDVTVTATGTTAPPPPVFEGWTVAELKAFAADHDPPIPVPSGATKAEILAILQGAIGDDEEP